MLKLRGVPKMKVQVLFDKQALKSDLRTGWGLSFLVDNRILFDTGEKGEWLFENLELLGIDIQKVEEVVISHDHWDHWGGLWDILKIRPNIKVYICPRFGKEFKEKSLELKAQLIEVSKFTGITQDIYLTGEIPGSYRGKYIAEQALVIKTGKGLTIITGCAHPGILKIIEKTKNAFPDVKIYSVFGGFHLMESDKRAVEIVAESLKKMGIAKVGPTHCAGNVAEDIFKKYYEGNFMPIMAGQNIEV